MNSKCSFESVFQKSIFIIFFDKVEYLKERLSMILSVKNTYFCKLNK